MSVEVTRLENGMRVVSHEMPHLHTVSLGVWVNAGARCEAPTQHGISHLLEHLAFKGTRRRTAQAIAEEIEAAGGDLNAATGMETTAYFARLLKEDLPLAVDVLADILLEPLFDPTELDRERQVIIQEINAAFDAPDDLVFELAQQVAYPGQSLGRSILGTASSVRGFTAENVFGYRDAHYGGPAMVLSAAGAVEHRHLVMLAEEAFARLPATSGPAWQAGAYKGGVALAEKPLEQTHLVLGFEAPGYTDTSFYALQVLTSALGGGMSSRLFQEVREKRGLCYAVGAFSSCYVDTGMMGVYAATSPDLADELMHVLTGEITRFAADVRADEVDRARAQLKAGLLMGLESSSTRADQIARQLLAFDRIVPVAEIAERVDAIGCADIRDLGARLLDHAVPTYTAVGTLNTVASYNTIAAQFA
jgi:predicted Zn-dependent peptidase